MLTLKHQVRRLQFDCDCDGINLKKAVLRGNKLCVKYLLQKGSNELATILQHVPLHLSAHSCEIVSLLLNAGADPNVSYVYPYSSFIYAIMEHCYACTEALLKCGAKVDVYNWVGFTPLMHAIRLQDNRLVNLLLKYGANPNQTTTDETLLPLFMVLDYNGIIGIHVPMLKILLEAGANPLLEYCGRTALSSAEGAVKDLLLTYCPIEHS